MKKKNRKQSWDYLNLAFQIQTANPSQKLILLFLGDRANNAGESWHGYRSIIAHLGLSRPTVSHALQYLRDELKILSWHHGDGGRDRPDNTNRYRLNLQAMRELVALQGNFDPETGKLRRAEGSSETETSSENELDSHPKPVKSDAETSSIAEPVNELNPFTNQLNPFTNQLNPCTKLVQPFNPNPQGTPKTNPHSLEPRPEAVFSGGSTVELRPAAPRGKPRPPVPLTPHVQNTLPVFSPAAVPDELALSAGLRWSGSAGAYMDIVTGREVSLAEAQRRIQRVEVTQ